MFQFKSIFARTVTAFILFIALIEGITYGFAFTLWDMEPWVWTIASAVCALPIAFLIAKWFSYSFNKDFRKIIKVARQVEHGEKGEVIKISRKDEVSVLAEAINNLVDRDKAVRDANEDPLTGLANRRYLMQRLEKLTKNKTAYTLMFIDLDGFKPINDEYGHDVGDEALRILSDRLGACVREVDVLCRLGGDEFVILFQGLQEKDVISERADKVLEMVRMPMWITGNRVRMGASIGIALYPKDGEDAETVLNASDESMYAAKQGGKNAYRFYS